MIKKKYKCITLSNEMTFMLKLAMGVFELKVPKEIDWEMFEILSRGNGLTSLIQANAKKNSVGLLEDIPILETFQKEQKLQIRYCMQQMQTLVVIMEDFKANGIRALSMKGPLLALELYGVPELRYSTDLDILVEPEKIQKAEKRLEALGYRFWKHENRIFDTSPKRSAVRQLEKDREDKHSVYIKNGMRVELHHEADTHWSVSFETLWANRREKQFLGKGIYNFGIQDNLSYLISHAAGHGYRRLSWLLELAILLRRPEVDKLSLYEDMKQKGIGALFVSTMIMLYQCPYFEFLPINTALFSFERNDDCVEVCYSRVMRDDFKRGFKIAELAWNQIKNSTGKNVKTDRKYEYLLPKYGKQQSKWAYIKSFFQPCQADLELIDIPDSMFFLYYIIRPFYKLWRITPFYRNKCDKGC